MQYYFEEMPLQRWLLFFFLAVTFPLTYLLAYFLNDHIWLILVAFTPLAGQLFVSNRVGNLLMAVSALFYSLAALRLEHPGRRAALIFYILVTVLMGVFGYFYRRRKILESNVYQEQLSHLQEELTLQREQYKNDLMVSVADKKKFEKYSMLNRISNAFGAELQLDKLLLLAVKEVQNVIGPERGRFITAASGHNSGEVHMQSLPVETQVDGILEDQFSSWIQEHKVGLLIDDAKNDFRFHALDEQAQVRSLMIVPMLIAGQVKGFVRVESPWENMFNVNDLQLLTIMTDIITVSTENARLFQQQKELSVTDSLTGLYLRRFLDQRLKEEYGRYQAHDTVFSLMILDIDHFKHINDRLGHIAGDQVLIQLAKLLQQESRSIDMVARYGGEEFIILLPNTWIEGALVLAERIRKKVRQYQFQALDQSLTVTVSIGVGECPRHAAEVELLIKKTDDALYRAKRNGRNQVSLAAEQPSSAKSPLEGGPHDQDQA